MIPHRIDPSEQNHRISVAVAATLSLTATSLLFVYVIALIVLTNIRPNLQPVGAGSTGRSLKACLQSWARHRLSFIRTPFGIMFMNLVFADFIQALGFGMNYVWVANPDVTCRSAHCHRMCTIQGVLIQLGDVASAFSNLMIAIQTFVILTFSWHMPGWVTWASLGLIWVPVCVLGLAPPTIMGNWSGSEPFYAWAGDWCWINQKFSPLRLFLHYLWIFISAFASIALYGHLFLRLQIHFRRSNLQAGLGWIAGKSRAGIATADMVEPPVMPMQGDHLRKKLERKARAMLMYPIAFIFMILPLSTYRLAALAGHDWGITAATVCGSMYCLSGFIDVLLFGTTRSILSVPVFSLNIGNPGGTAINGTTGMGMSTSGLSGAGTRSAAFRVEVVQETVIDLDESTDVERKHSGSSNGPLTAHGHGGAHPSTNNANTNPLLRPIRVSNATHDSDHETRHPSVTIFSADHNLVHHHKTATDPTPWYEPLPAKR